MVGLREQKKERTRQEIFAAAQRLFARRGFEGVKVAEVAEAANVSEMTVYNYFPTKEDLFFAGMHFFEEGLIDAVRSRHPGESALKAFRRRVMAGGRNLEDADRADAILKAGRAIAASGTLRTRERDIVDGYTRQLALVIGGQDDVEASAAAAAMMATHRALVARTRQLVGAGVRGPALAEDFRTQARRAFARLDRGLGNYAVRA